MPSAHSAVCDRVLGQHPCDPIVCLQLIPQCVTEFMASIHVIQSYASRASPSLNPYRRKLCQNNPLKTLPKTLQGDGGYVAASSKTGW
jgi:hypothetical protein